MLIVGHCWPLQDLLDQIGVVGVVVLIHHLYLPLYLRDLRPPTAEPCRCHDVLGEEKYGPGSEPQWKAGGTRYLNLYKALLEEPSRTRRTKLLEYNSRAKMGDGRIMRRPARARIRNQ